MDTTVSHNRTSELLDVRCCLLAAAMDHALTADAGLMLSAAMQNQTLLNFADAPLCPLFSLHCMPASIRVPVTQSSHCSVPVCVACAAVSALRMRQY